MGPPKYRISGAPFGASVFLDFLPLISKNSGFAGAPFGASVFLVLRSDEIKCRFAALDFLPRLKV